MIAKENAIKVFRSEYGRSHIKKYYPYIVTSGTDSTWVVKGTLHSDVGGTPVAEVSKVDCSIVKITHYK